MDPFADELATTSQLRQEFDDRLGQTSQPVANQPTKNVTAVPPATPAEVPQPAKKGTYQSNPQPVGIHNDRYDATLKSAERDFGLGTDRPNLAGLRDLIDEEHDGLIGPSDPSNPRGEENRRRQAVQLKALADAYEGATGRKLAGVRRDIDALLNPAARKASSPTQPQQPTAPTTPVAPAGPDGGAAPAVPFGGSTAFPFPDKGGVAASTDEMVKANPSRYLPAVDSILKRELETLKHTVEGPDRLARIRKIANLMAVYENNTGTRYEKRTAFEGLAGDALTPPTAEQELMSKLPDLAPVPVGKPFPVGVPVHDRPQKPPPEDYPIPKAPKITKPGTPAATQPVAPRFPSQPTGGGATTLGPRIKTTKPVATPRPSPTAAPPQAQPQAAPKVPGAAIRFPIKAGKPVEPKEPSQGPVGSVREAVERDAPKIRQQLADRGMVDEAKVGAIIESAAQAVDYALKNGQPSGGKPTRTYVDLGDGDDTVKATLDIFPTANGRQRYVLRLLPPGQQSAASPAPVATSPGSTIDQPTTPSGDTSVFDAGSDSSPSGDSAFSSPTTPGSTLMPTGGIVIRDTSSEPRDATPVEDDSSLFDADVTVKPPGSVGPDDRTPLEIPLPTGSAPRLGGGRRPVSLPSAPAFKTPEPAGGPMPDPVYALDQNLWRLDINTPKDVAAAKSVIDETADFIRANQGTGSQEVFVGDTPIQVVVNPKGVEVQFPDGTKVPYSPASGDLAGGREKPEQVPGQPSVAPDRPQDVEPSTKPWFTPGTAPPPKGFRVLPTPQPTTVPQTPIPTAQPAASQKANPIVIRSFKTSPPPPVQPVVDAQPPVTTEPPTPTFANPADESKYVSDLQKFKRNNYQFPMAMPRDGSVNPALWQEFDALRKGPMRREFEAGDKASRESLFKKLWDMDGGKYRPLLVPPAVKRPTTVKAPAQPRIRVTAPGVASPPPPPTVTSAPPPADAAATGGGGKQNPGADDSYVQDYLLRSGGIRMADVQKMGRDAVREKLASLAAAAMSMSPHKLAGVAEANFMTVPELMESLGRLANPSVESPKPQPEDGPLAGLPTDPKARVKSIRSRIKKLDQKIRGNITDAQKSVLQAKIDTLQDELSKLFHGGQTQLSVTIPRRRPLAFTVRSKLLGV